MKTRRLVSILILVLAVLIISEGYATDRKAVSDEDFIKAWSGTWINEDYGKMLAQKRIYYPDLTWEFYHHITDTGKDYWGKSIILDKWLDSEGNVWYRMHWESLTVRAKGYHMGKISNSGNTLEATWASESYPIEEWEPDRFEYNYFIYYRQE